MHQIDRLFKRVIRTFRSELMETSSLTPVTMNQLRLLIAERMQRRAAALRLLAHRIEHKQPFPQEGSYAFVSFADDGREACRHG